MGFLFHFLAIPGWDSAFNKKGRKNNPQITQITQIKLKADRGVKKYNLRESAKSADCFELRHGRPESARMLR